MHGNSEYIGLTTVSTWKDSSSASCLATALLDPCILLFLPVARLTTARPHPMPPCCKAPLIASTDYIHKCTEFQWSFSGRRLGIPL